MCQIDLEIIKKLEDLERWVFQDLCVLKEMDIDTIECVSSSDGIEDDEIDHLIMFLQSHSMCLPMDLEWLPALYSRFKCQGFEYPTICYFSIMENMTKTSHFQS